MSPIRFGAAFIIVYVLGFILFSWLVFGSINLIALIGGIAGIVIAFLVIDYFRTNQR